MRISRQLCVVLAFSVATICCGEDPAPTNDAATSDSSGATSAADSGAQDTGPQIAVESSDLNITVQVQAESISLNGSVLTPADCQPAEPCPLIVVVADRDTDAHPTLESAAEKLASKAHSVVVIFNLPGRGPGSLKSGGADDFGGPNHVAAVKEVMKLLSKRKYVDPAHTGYVTVGTGLIPVARALKLHGSNTLKSVQFLVDVEGPTDRCAISQAPADADKGVGPDDGPGVSDSACHFDADSPHSAMYPAAKDGKPAAIVCSPAAWPITKTGKDCKATEWWNGREPYNELKAINARYQRIQFQHDHRQASHFTSRHAFTAVASSNSRWFTLNNLPPCKSLPSTEFCDNNPCWLSGAWGNGMAPAPYAGGGFEEITADELFGEVLPGYLLRVMDAKTYKNCK